MDAKPPGGPTRLRGAGVGSIGGGLTLGALSIALQYALAAGIVLAVGIAVWALGRRGAHERTGAAIGVAAVGAIGLFEAGGLGLGVGPELLAVIAIGAGGIDVIVGGMLGRVRNAGEER